MNATTVALRRRRRWRFGWGEELVEAGSALRAAFRSLCAGLSAVDGLGRMMTASGAKHAQWALASVAPVPNRRDLTAPPKRGDLS